MQLLGRAKFLTENENPKGKMKFLKGGGANFLNGGGANFLRILPPPPSGWRYYQDCWEGGGGGAKYLGHHQVRKVGEGTHCRKQVRELTIFSTPKQPKSKLELYCIISEYGSLQIPKNELTLRWPSNDSCMPLKPVFHLANFFARTEKKSNLIGWRQTLTTSPANYIRFLLVRANKFAKWKSGFRKRVCESIDTLLSFLTTTCCEVLPRRSKEF